MEEEVDGGARLQHKLILTILTVSSVKPFFFMSSVPKSKAKGRSMLWYVVVLGPLLMAASLLYVPNFWIHILILADYYYEPFVIFDSPLAESYHNFLMERLPDSPEIPLPELSLDKLTKDSLYEMSNGYTFPVVIRGLLKDLPAVQSWGNKTWWAENYGDEEVLCKYVEQIGSDSPPACTIKLAMGDDEGNDRMYISGESRLFMRRPELEEMLQSDSLEAVAPGARVFTQLFMGYPHMGSDVHSAVGCNMFRMITGRKKWWLIPPSQTPYIRPALNKNGFSAHTLTKVGKEDGGVPSPHMNKLVRYTVSLDPGDVLLNPAWFWHGIKNLGEDPDELVIGVPTRYRIQYSLPAFRNDFLFTAIALKAIADRFGSLKAFLSNAGNLQSGIELARNARASEMAKSASDMQEIRESIEREM